MNEANEVLKMYRETLYESGRFIIGGTDLSDLL